MTHRDTQTQLPGSVWPKGYLFANVNAIYPCHLIQEETEAQEGLQNEFVLVSFRMLLAVNNRWPGKTCFKILWFNMSHN